MRRMLLAAAVAVGLLVIFVGGSVLYLSWSACLGGESNGLPVEDFTVKPTLLQRQGYGRANFDLLSARSLAT